MIPDSDKIALAQVHAYVDAQLSDEQCQRVEDYLDIHPDKFELLQQYLGINEHYQSLYDPVLKEEIPQTLLDRLYQTHENPYQTHTTRIGSAADLLNQLAFFKPVAGGGSVLRRIYPFRRNPDVVWNSDSLPFGDQLRSRASLFSSLRRYLPSAPPWLVRLRSHASLFLARALDSYRDVSWFAAASILIIGMLIGMYGSETTANRETPVSQDYGQFQAMQAHGYYHDAGRNTLATSADSQQRLLTWLSDRLGVQMRLIDIAELGFDNKGVVLLPAKDNVALVTVYGDDHGQTLTLYVSSRESRLSSSVKCASQDKGNSLCSWGDGKMQFIAVSDLSLAETRQMAEWMQQHYGMSHRISSNEYFFSQTLGTINA